MPESDQRGLPYVEQVEAKLSLARPFWKRSSVQSAVSLGVMAAAFLLRVGLQRLIGAQLPPFLTFYPALIAVGILFGLRACLLATVFSSLLTEYFVFNTAGSRASARVADTVALIFYIAGGLVLCWIAERYRRYQAQVAALKEEQVLREGETKLRACNARLDMAIEIAALGEWELNLQEETGTQSARHAVIFGYAPEQTSWSRGQFLKHVLPELRAKLEETITSTPSGRTWETETQIKRVDGELRWIWVHGRRLADESGRPTRAFGTVMDVTARKREEAARKESELRYRVLFDNNLDAIFMSTPDGRVHAANPAACEMFGMTQEELCLAGRYGISDPADPEQAAAIREREQTGRFRGELPFRRKDGTKLIGDCSSVIVSGAGEKSSFVIIRDITEHRRAEEALRESEANLRSTLENSRDCVYRFNLHTQRYEYVSRTVEQILGYTPEEFMAISLEEMIAAIHPDDRDAVRTALAEVDSTGKGEVEYRHLSKTGDYSLVSTRMLLVRDCDGKPLYRCGSARDITESRRVKRELRESEERFRRVVEASPLGIYIQTDGLFRYLNEAALKMFGAESAEAIIGENFLDRLHPDFREEVSRRAQRVMREHAVAPMLEEKHLRMDGTAIDTEVIAVPFLYEARHGAIVFFQDITERKRQETVRQLLEQQLRQAQKMEAIGRLAGGVAHDFNNLLMVIQTYTELLQDRLPMHDNLRKNTEQVLKAAERGASLTRQMLAFSRKQIVIPMTLDLNAVIGQATRMLQRLIGEDIEFNLVEGEELWPVEADQDQIFQVLMNLCVNSRDAMPQGGSLTIATANATVKPGEAVGQTYVVPGEYVTFSVTDDGVGISKDIQQEIFEPFFTTKEVGKGTGLGLATVYGILKQSGGYVTVESDIGQGACFTVYLPKSKRASAGNSSARAEAPSGGRETLLVVEDEGFLRIGICEFLSSLGYKVLAASSGEEALMLASEQEHIDLLLTDVVMPKMSGRELSEMLGTLRPELKIIHMSGYSDDTMSQYGLQRSHATFLQKPFSLGTLARKVRDTLERTEQA